jgi:hypothetical protein
VLLGVDSACKEQWTEIALVSYSYSSEMEEVCSLLDPDPKVRKCLPRGEWPQILCLLYPVCSCFCSCFGSPINIHTMMLDQPGLLRR